MAHSYDRIIVHIVWATKFRKPFLIPMVVEALCAYLAGVLHNFNSKAIRINAMYDHVHIICTLPRTVAVATLVERMKTQSSKWIKFTYPGMSQFAWQPGYGVFSVDHHSLQRAINYVDNQQTHHLKQGKYQDYEAQLRELLEYYGVDYDEEYFLK